MFQVDDMDGHKMFEIVGEALPQFILGLVYLINNWEDVSENDKFFDDQPLPTSLLSLIFSLGTLIIGITKAGIYWKTVYNRDEEKEATNDDENKEASPIEMKEVSA
jgi:hypothetical protein